MISRNTLSGAATKHHTRDVNIAREYVQHVFLRALYQLRYAGQLLFKGGTALRIVFGSPRFSEDLDFSSFGLSAKHIEALFLEALAELERSGLAVVLHEKSHETSGGYFGEARIRVYEHDVRLEINVNAKQGEQVGEYKLIQSDFAPAYSLLILPEAMLVQEKITALLTRKKPRDFYDLYFMLRAHLIPPERRELLGPTLDLVALTTINFRQELEVFLPEDHHTIIRDFKNVLLTEVKRNLE